MTDAPTPAVLRHEDQGSLRASPFVPTEFDAPLSAKLDRLKNAAEARVDALARLTARSASWPALDRATAAFHNALNSLEHDDVLKLIEAARQGPAGYEGPQGRSEQKDHPTPVGGLEPEDRALNILLDFDGSPPDACFPTGAMPLGLVSELIQKISDQDDAVSTIQAEIERLRAANQQAVHMVGNMVFNLSQKSYPDVSRADQVRSLRHVLQALGGSHD